MEERNVYAELSSIRDLMERSSKFISLSGLAGVLAGLYALAGAGLAYTLMKPLTLPASGNLSASEPAVFWPLCLTALVVLILSIATCCWLTMRRARSKPENVWNPVSRRMLAAVGIPLFTGGLFIIILLLKEQYNFIAPACLIFYGLALASGSQYTYNDIKWLGMADILLGLIALMLPEYGLVLWTIGFGLLHILYGSIMHFKYER